MVSDVVEKVYIKENQRVRKGELLVVLNSRLIESRLAMNRNLKAEYDLYVADLEHVTQLASEKTILKTDVYKQQLKQFLEQTADYKTKIAKAKKELERNKTLFEKKVIAEKDYDDICQQYYQAENQLKIFVGQTQSGWQSDMKTYKISLNEVESQIEQLLKEKQNYSIKSPVTGFVEQFSGIFEGNMLSAGQKIAVISPDTSIIAEVYVNPKDMGYINQKSKIKIQVDSYNYNEWGIIEADIREISSDMKLINNSPYFVVKCNLSKDYLQLKNGIKGSLKKGMTIRARFLITKKSLFQLLYQKADKWLNPSQN